MHLCKLEVWMINGVINIGEAPNSKEITIASHIIKLNEKKKNLR